MTDEMKKHMKNARLYVSQGGCGGISCLKCAAGVHGCATFETDLHQGSNEASDSQIQWFRDFIANNEGTVSPKSNKNRRVIVTLDGIEYERGLIDGTAIDSHLADLDKMISRRDEYNVEMRAVRKLLGRHATMKGRGEFK